MENEFMQENMKIILTLVTYIEFVISFVIAKRMH